MHRVGDALVNFYLVDTGAGLVLVDAGLPGHWPNLRGALRAIGQDISNITDVLITHGHLDHIGLTERVRETAGARIWVHESDAPILRSPLRASAAWRSERSIASYAVRRPASLRAPLHLARLGALRTPAVRDLVAFGRVRFADHPRGARRPDGAARARRALDRRHGRSRSRRRHRWQAVAKTTPVYAEKRGACVRGPVIGRCRLSASAPRSRAPPRGGAARTGRCPEVS